MTADELRELVRGLEDGDFEMKRRGLAKEHGVRVEFLDRMRDKRSATATVTKPVDEEQPWEQPVDGAWLITEIVSTLLLYLVMPNEAALAVALWILHTHAHDAASRSPILLIWGPMPDCGKSTALDVIARMVRNPLLATGLTLAYVLRKATGYTVLWDEIDKELKKKGQNIDGWFTCGYQRGRMFGRCEGDANTPTDYDPWLPKCIAQIGKPYDEQVFSRCLPIEMKRKLEGEVVHEFHDTEDHPELLDLRRMCARWALDCLDRLRGARPGRPEGLRGTRPFDNWRPLFAIADEIGEDWSEKARAAALKLQPKTDHDRTVELLRDIKAMIDETPLVTFWKSKEIVEHLVALEDREYETANRGRVITQKWLATQLQPFGIESSQPWVAGPDGKKAKGQRGYEITFFADAFARYLSSPPFPSKPSDPSDPPESGSDGSDSSEGQDGQEGKSEPQVSQTEARDALSAPEAPKVGQVDTLDGDSGGPESLCSEGGEGDDSGLDEPLGRWF